MRKIVLLICVMAVSSMARAENKATSWSNLNIVREGEKIQVREMNKTKVTGTLVNVSDTAISVETPAGPQSIQRQDIQTVKRMSTRHRWVNALILGGVGGGVGAGIGAAMHHGCPSNQTFCLDIGGRSLPAGIGAVAGFLGGATVGALLPAHETVYTQSAH
jgi:hypothetical protein